MNVIDIPCPRCAAAKGEPCDKEGTHFVFVSGPAFHMERWDATDEALTYQELERQRRATA